MPVGYATSTTKVGDIVLVPAHEMLGTEATTGLVTKVHLSETDISWCEVLCKDDNEPAELSLDTGGLLVGPW